MWRLFLLIVLFLFSLLVLFRAPTNFLWRVSVAITEFPQLFFGVSLLLFILCFWSVNYRTPVLIIAGLTTILYLLPIIQAYKRGNYLTEELAISFPTKNNPTFLQSPFSFFNLFSGIGIKTISPQIFTYKTLPEKKLNIDFYSSTTTSKSPCVIVIHGGSWREGDSKQLPALNSYLANKGYHVAAINYRLAPNYKSPAPVEDVQSVINYLTTNAQKLNIDTSNFVLIGRSAGGQIALCAAYTFNNKNIKGVVSFYAPADMVWGGKIKVNSWVLNTNKVFNEYLGGTIDEVPEKFKESSACEFVTKTSTPTLIIHGEHDAMVAYEHSVRLNKKLSQNNVQHYFLNLPCATHGCDYNISGPSGQLSTFAIERFINSVTTH